MNGIDQHDRQAPGWQRIALLGPQIVIVVLFVVFARVGVSNLPLWDQGLNTASFHNLFDSARYHLSAAEEILENIPNVQGTALRRENLDRALSLIEQSLRERPLNPFAWHDRALVHQLKGDPGLAAIDLARSMAFGPFEKTLASARIDLAIRLWDRLDATQQQHIRDQIRWIWTLDSPEMVRLSTLSARHYAVIRGSLADLPEAAVQLDR